MKILEIKFTQEESDVFTLEMFKSRKEFKIESDDSSDVLESIKTLIDRINRLRIKILDGAPESGYDPDYEDLDGTFDFALSLSIVPDKENTYVFVNLNSRFFYSAKSKVGDVELKKLSLLIDVVKFINSQNSEHTLLAPLEFDSQLY